MRCYRVAWFDDLNLETIGYLFCYDRHTAQIRIGDIGANIAAYLRDDEIAQIPVDSHPHHGIGRTFVASVINLPQDHPLAEKLMETGTAWVDRESELISWSDANLLPVIKYAQAPYSWPKLIKPPRPNKPLEFIWRAPRHPFVPDKNPPEPEEISIFTRVSWQNPRTLETVGYTFHQKISEAIHYVSAVLDNSNDPAKGGLGLHPFPHFAYPRHGIEKEFYLDEIKAPHPSLLFKHIVSFGFTDGPDDEIPYFASIYKAAMPAVWREACDAQIVTSGYYDFYASDEPTSNNAPSPPVKLQDMKHLAARRKAPKPG